MANDTAAAAAVVDEVSSSFGAMEILVNNAGLTHWGPLAQTSVEDFDRLVAGRLDGREEGIYCYTNIIE